MIHPYYTAAYTTPLQIRQYTVAYRTSRQRPPGFRSTVQRGYRDRQTTARISLLVPWLGENEPPKAAREIGEDNRPPAYSVMHGKRPAWTPQADPQRLPKYRSGIPAATVLREFRT